jgi:hypothetical protein
VKLAKHRRIPGPATPSQKISVASNIDFPERRFLIAGQGDGTGFRRCLALLCVFWAYFRSRTRLFCA